MGEAALTLVPLFFAALVTYVVVRRRLPSKPQTGRSVFGTCWRAVVVGAAVGALPHTAIILLFVIGRPAFEAAGAVGPTSSDRRAVHDQHGVRRLLRLPAASQVRTEMILRARANPFKAPPAPKEPSGTNRDDNRSVTDQDHRRSTARATYDTLPS